VEVTQEINLKPHTTTEQEPVVLDDEKKATYIIRKPTSSTSRPPLPKNDPGEETTEGKAPDV
jgi:hypothetical protein